jgi:hypothetical protein
MGGKISLSFRIVGAIGAIAMSAVAASTIFVRLAGNAADLAPRAAADVDELVIPPIALPEATGSRMAAIIERPLFSPSRKRPSAVRAPLALVEAPPVVTPPPLPDPEYVLAGVSISTSARRALLRNPGEESGNWFDMGSATGEGWRISKVTPNSVDLAFGARTITLRLHEILR